MGLACSNGQKSEDKVFLLALYSYTFLAFLPFVNSLPVIFVQMPIMVFSFLCLLLSVAGRPGRERVDMLVVVAVALVLVNYLLIYLRRDNTGASLTNMIGANYVLFVNTFPILLVASGGFERIDCNKFAKFFLFLILFISITTMIGTFRYVAPCRQLATPSNPSLNMKYRREGIGGFGFSYFLAIFCPFLLGKSIKKVTVFNTLVVAVTGVCAIRTEYTIAIAVLALAIVGFFFLRKNGERGIIGILLFLLVCIFAYTFRETILKLGIAFFKDKSWSVTYRLENLLNSVQISDRSGDVAIRFELYGTSIKSFLSNPICGGFFANGLHVGNHSEILDLLGHAGLIGLAIVLLIIQWLKKCYSVKELYIDMPTKILMVECLIIALINPFNAPEMFFGMLIVPIIFENKKDYIGCMGTEVANHIME